MAKTEDEKMKYHGKQKCLACGTRKRNRINSAYCVICRALFLLKNRKKGDKEWNKKK